MRSGVTLHFSPGCGVAVLDELVAEGAYGMAEEHGVLFDYFIGNGDMYVLSFRLISWMCRLTNNISRRIKVDTYRVGCGDVQEDQDPEFRPLNDLSRPRGKMNE
jgi:hypothetical protein